MINPHFKIPFRFTLDDAELLEQDSDAEIMQNVGMVMRYQRGERIDDPEFGIEDPNFRENGASFDDLHAAIEHGEPRAVEILSRDPDSLNDLIDNVHIGMGANNA